MHNRLIESSVCIVVMAPNTTQCLSYENEDVELLPTYLKRGKSSLSLPRRKKE